MKTIPSSYLTPCSNPGKVTTLPYGEKFALLYTSSHPAARILYLIHGGGGNQYSFFCPQFLSMIDHMIEEGVMKPLYIVSPCFYDPAETDKSPSSSGIAVAKFSSELRSQIIPLVEKYIGIDFSRDDRIISGFSMGGVTTWYAFLQALDLFSLFIPLSGDCWIFGETGGGKYPAQTAARLVGAVAKQGALPFHIHAVTGSKDIAFPNLDAQIKAMQKFPDVFGHSLEYDVLGGGVHDYETMFRYLYNVLPSIV